MHISWMGKDSVMPIAARAEVMGSMTPNSVKVLRMTPWFYYHKATLRSGPPKR